MKGEPRGTGGLSGYPKRFLHVLGQALSATHPADHPRKPKIACRVPEVQLAGDANAICIEIK
jgi:hypothetical protein